MVRVSLGVIIAGLIIIISPIGCSMGAKHSGQPSPPGSATNAPWSFIQIGDLHAGSVLRLSSWSNTVNAVLQNKTAWNLKLIVTPGDVYESATNGMLEPIIYLTNDFWHLKANRISILAVPGNHDSDDDYHVGASNLLHWNDVFGTNFYANDPYFYTNRFPGDTRECAWKITNGTTKVLFIGLRWIDAKTSIPTFDNTQQVFTAYQPSCDWASNLAARLPDHLVIPMMHYFMDTNGTPSTKDLTGDPDDQNMPHQSYINEGPGIVAWNTLKSLPNLMMVLSGHVRADPMVRSVLTASDGHPVESLKFNTQTVHISSPATGTNFNGGTFVLFTVSPATHTIRAQVYNSDYGRFLTNGEFSAEGFTNDWTFPFKQLP
jgi:Calcineurin-like phosphoesterase